MNKALLGIVVVAAGVWSGPVWAQRLITAEEAIDLALGSHPAAQIAAIELQRAELQVRGEEGRYEPVFSASSGFRFGSTPQLSQTGTRLLESNSLVISAALGHTLPIGTQISLSTEVGRTFRDTVELGTLGTAYDADVTLQASQPLLRGAGRDVGEAGLRAARLGRLAAQHAQSAELTSLRADVLSAYWGLWSAQRAREIQTESLEVARKELADAELRLEVGALAPAQLIPMRIEIARAEESLVNAGAAVRQRSIALAELVGLEPNAALAAAPDAPAVAGLPSLDDAVQIALEQNAGIRRLRASLASADVDIEVAVDAAQMKLDGVGSLTVAGLGTAAGDAFEQLASMQALVAYIGVSLELPLRNTVREVAVDRARAAKIRQDLELSQAKRTLRTRIATLIDAQQTLDARIGLARRTAELARENVSAQTTRFDAGKGTTLDVIDALESFRNAEFQVVALEVERALNTVALDEALGQ